MSSPSKTLFSVLFSLGILVCLFLALTDREDPVVAPPRAEQTETASASTRTAGNGKEIPLSPADHAFEETAAPSDSGPIDVSGLEPFEAFEAWIGEYRDHQDSDSERPGMIRQGLALAETRRPLIRQLIHENPEIALAHALTLDQYHALPEAIRSLVEAPFSRQAEIDVFPRCDNASATLQRNLKTTQDVDIHLTFSPSSHRPETGTETLDAFTWGWRAEAPSRTRAPVQGIQLDGLAAIRESVFQLLLDSEIPIAEELFAAANPDRGLGFATGRPLPEKPVVALAAGQLFYFADPPAFEEFQKRAGEMERKLGPENGANLIFEKLAATIAGAEDGAEGFDLDEVEAEAGKIEAESISGNRKVLMIRIDFPDKTGSPIAASTLQARMDGDVNTQCLDMSFDKLGLTTTVETPLVRMPKPSTFYNGTDTGSKNNGALYNDALAAAAAAGINTSGYNHRCIIMKGIGMGYCGLATVGGSKIWLPCHGSKVIVHELGHNFGVSHASFHDPDDDNDPLGAGSSSEYGDNTDIMGGGGVSSGHFHSQFKTKLAWLDGSQRHNFNSGNTNNIYRIFRFDHPDTAAANAKRAVRVYRGTNNEYLWINYRQRFGGSNYQNYLKGAQVYWQKAGKSKSWLLDLTPGGGKNNSGLGLGRTFSDTRKDLHITALKRGGSSPNQWLEVQVTRGPFAGNRAPAFTHFGVPSRVPVNEPIVVGSAGSDPDGDPLAYHFDFKDGTVVGNDGTAASRTYTWTSKGSKNLTITLSDRKGLVATQTLSVSVENRLNPPANLSASDMAPYDRIQLNWGSVSGGTSFAVYRSETNSVATARQIGTASTNSYGDTSAASETPYFYWVQALGSGAASNLSNSDAGYRAFNPPDPPAVLTATEGAHTDRVRLNWQPVAAADLFKVYRGTTPDSADATAIGQTSSLQFTDLTADPGVAYFYWIRAQNSSGLGEFSAPATGFRQLHRPTNVRASNGTGDQEVTVTWSAVEGAERYEIYRSDASGSAGILIGTATDLSFTDLPPEELRKYDYSVRARSDASGVGDHSSSASGYRTIQPPENIDATDGYFDDKIRISWSALPGPIPVTYKIYRSTDSDGNGTRLIGVVTETTIDDNLAEPGVPYFYFVRAILESATITHHSVENTLNDVASPLSLPEPGHRAGEIQFRPDALIGKRPFGLRGNNLYNFSGARQELREISKRGRKVICFFEVQNDGEATPDRIRVAGPRSNRYFGISYRESRSFANVTAQITRIGYFVELDPDEAGQLRVEVKPSRRTRGKTKRRLLKILASSTEVSRRGDVARLFIQTRR